MRNIPWRRWPWRRIAIFACVALGIYLVVGILLAGEDTPPLPGQQPMQLYGGHVNGNHISTKSWSFDYTHAQLSPDGTIGSIDGVRHGVIYKKGKPYAHISAEHISVNTISLDFTATGKVTVTRIGGPQHETFETDEVIWTNGLHILRLDHLSYFRTGTQTLRIKNALINLGTDQIHLGELVGGVDLKK